MSSNEVRLGDIADLNGGYAFKSGDYKDSGVFVLRTVNIKDDGSITREGATYISEEDARDYERFYLEPLDTLFVMVGATLGKTGLVQKKDLPALLNQNMWVIRTKNPEQLDALYLYYKYSIESSKILKYSTGAARDFVRRDDFRNIKFVLPRIEKQKEIAKILGDLDRKIELNRRMNETLEQIGQALFKHYFIHNPESESWKEGSITEVFNVAYGKNLPTSKLLPKGYPVFGGNGQIGFYDKYLYEGKQVLVSCRGNGSGVVNITKKQSFVTNNSLIIEIPTNSNFSFEYLKYFALTRNNSFFEYVTGSAQPQITIDSISKCRVRLPDKDLIDKFTSYVSGHERMIDKLQNEIVTLTELRDLLLPKLMSGQINV